MAGPPMQRFNVTKLNQMQKREKESPKTLCPSPKPKLKKKKKKNFIVAHRKLR
jgi:hypothetical protein